MEIPDIKTHLNIIELVKHYNHEPNRNDLIKCPFHADDKPSLQLYPETNTWHCFGCGKGTDGIDFIQLKESCTTHEAIKKAEAFLDVGIKTLDIRQEKSLMSNIQRPISEQERIKALTIAFTYFSRSTGSSEKARTYLKSRGLDKNKITVGYDAHNFHKGKEVTAELLKQYLATGLIYPDKLGRPNSYHSFFDGCIVFPIFNEKNEIINLYGRCTDENKESKHRYLKGKHQGIYPHYPKAETERLIITESIIDAATLQQHSSLITQNSSLLACYGTNNFTEEHQAAIRNLKALKEVVFFFDGDTAGKLAAAQHAAILQEQMPLLKIYYVETPENEDINSLAQSYEEKAAELYKELLSNRKFFVYSQDNFSFKGVHDNASLSSQEKKETKVKETKAVQTLETRNSKPETNSSPTTQDSLLNTENPDQLIYENEWLTATMWGGIDIYNLKKLRATLHIKNRANEYLEYRDTVDLYSHRDTEKLIRSGGEYLEISTHKMKQSITELTRSLEKYRTGEREKERQREEEEKRKHQESFTPQELQAGEKLLKDKDLMQKTENHIKNIGLVGEEEKGMLLFFILLTRMFKDPLHALVQGKSGSGKTYLLKKIASLIPKAHIRITTALTENTLYHSLKDFWKHMILLIEDLDGAMSALLPLREMMSNQSISKLSTEKNLKTGEFEQKILYVEGPICVAGATTKDKIYEDNANRSFLIQVNETSDHQERVLEYQRKEIAGLLDKSQEKQAQTLLKAAQLHLERLEIIIPFGEELRIPDYVFKKLRTNAHYLTLIKAIAFWNQKQREIKQSPEGTKFIEANLEDVEWANKLSKDVLLRKSDELNGALRGFFESIKSYLRSAKANSFFASEIRNKFRMHPQQLKRYLEELRQRGYIQQISRNRKTGYEYEILMWDDYEILQSGMTVLDKVLEGLRKKYKK